MKMEKLFKISKPYGYYIPEVNKTIEEYNKVISDLRDTIVKHQIREKELNSELERLREEVVSLHGQLSNLNVPDQSSVTEFMIMQNFMEKNGSLDKGLKVPFNSDGTLNNANKLGEDVGEESEKFEIQTESSIDIDVDSDRAFDNDVIIEIPDIKKENDSVSEPIKFEDLFIGPDKNENGILLSDDEIE